MGRAEYFECWVYASDAVVMQLVLTSGFTGNEGSFHDLNYMLTETGLLDSTKGVANTIRFCGTLTVVGASLAAVYFSLQEPEPDEDL